MSSTEQSARFSKICSPRHTLAADIETERDTRVHLIRTLQMLDSKRVDAPARKHGNIPL